MILTFMTGLLTVLCFYVVVFALAEGLYRAGTHAQITRKVTHIGGGIISAGLPFLVTLPMAVALGVFFLGVLVWTKKAGLLKSVHQANEHSRGAALFPISLICCALLYWPTNPLIYQGAALILGLSDGLAGVIGQKIGRQSYHITGHKTAEGSLVFFIITIFTILGLLVYNQSSIGIVQISGIIIAALLLTLVEGIVSKGWDNLPIAVLGGLAVYLLL